MKTPFSLLSVSGLTALTLTVSTAAADFSIRGSIAGMPDSVKVLLVDIEDPNGKRKILAETIASGDDFYLKGDISSPRMCELVVQRPSPKSGDYIKSIATRVMAEPAEMKVSSSLSFDSLRNSRGVEGLIDITGSNAHREFCEYFAEVYPAEKKESDASYQAALRFFESNDNKDTMAIYNARKDEAMNELIAARHRFIAAHPSYNISAYLTQKELEKVFAYTSDEIDRMVDRVKLCPDTTRVATVNRRSNYARRYALQRQCPDFEVTHADGTIGQFSSLLHPGKFTFIDFWASWCGPCRAAIPHVRELYKKYDGKLDVYSISVDEDEAAWRKAMEKEQMEWAQMRLDGDKQRAEGLRAFFINSIPRLILLYDKGEVICSTNLPDEATACLAKHLDDGFTLKGELPGLPAGCKIELVSIERGNGGKIAQTVSVDGGFTLSGKVSSPTLSEIRIQVPDSDIMSRGISMMVENVPMTVSAAHIDSVPPRLLLRLKGTETREECNCHRGTGTERVR